MLLRLFLMMVFSQVYHGAGYAIEFFAGLRSMTTPLRSRTRQMHFFRLKRCNNALKFKFINKTTRYLKSRNHTLPVLTAAAAAAGGFLPPFAVHQPCMQFRRRPARGFTLVECALALGIVAIAFVPIFGLLPTGLNTARQAINYSIGSNIAQFLFNEAQQTDFNVLTATPDTARPVRYFDNQGSEIKTATSPSVIYHANTRVLATTVYPGAAIANANVATVTIQVACNPINQTLVTDSDTRLWAVTNRQPMLTFSFYVSRAK